MENNKINVLHTEYAKIASRTVEVIELTSEAINGKLKLTKILILTNLDGYIKILKVEKAEEDILIIY